MDSAINITVAEIWRTSRSKIVAEFFFSTKISAKNIGQLVLIVASMALLINTGAVFLVQLGAKLIFRLSTNNINIIQHSDI